MKKTLLTIAAIVTIITVLISGCSVNAATRDAKSIVVQETEKTKQETALIFDTNIDTARFYYNQLSEESKKIYEKLLESKNEFIENEQFIVGSIDGKYGADYNVIKSMFEPAMLAYMLDNPVSSMWVNTYTYTMEPIIKYDSDGRYEKIEKFNIIIAPSEEHQNRYADFETPEDTKNAINLVEKQVQEFVKNLTGTDEEKLIKIRDWILKGAKYDETISVTNLRSIYGAIVQKKCVCAGFAYAFKYVADMAKLQVITVTGTGVTKEEITSHAWNNMVIDSKWVLADLTWSFFNIELEKTKASHIPNDLLNVPSNIRNG